MGLTKQAVTGLIGIAVGLLAGNVLSTRLIVVALVALLAAYACLLLWEKKYPISPPPWASVLHKQNEELRDLVARLLPPVTGAGGIVGPVPTISGTGQVLEAELKLEPALTAIKQRGNWQVIHTWGPDIGPTPEPGVIVAVRSVDGEKVRISSCEVTDPVGITFGHDFAGSESWGSASDALAHLQPTDFAATAYPKMFTNELAALRDGRYEVRWVASRDGVTEVELLSDAFEMEGGKLMP